MPVDLRSEAHDALRRTIEMNRDTLQIANETNTVLQQQEGQIRQIAQTVEVIDRRVDWSDKEAGKINSCCGYGFWHWLKRKLCCMDGDAVQIRESRVKELKRSETVAHEPPVILPTEPIYVPEQLVHQDSFDRELSVIAHQVEEMKQDALHKRAELDLQNKMLNVTTQQTVSTGMHMSRVSGYMSRIN